MRTRTRHLLILLGVPTLLILALGGWVVEALRQPFVPRRRAFGRGISGQSLTNPHATTR